MQLEYISVLNQKATLHLRSGKYLLKDSLHRYLNKLCLSYGSSLDGVIKSFNYYVRAIQKTPLVISIDHKLLLFYLVSLNSNNNIVLNYYEIKEYYRYGLYQTKIVFNSSNDLIVDYDIRSIRHQYKRIQFYLERREKSTYLTQLLCYNTKGECNG